MSDLISRSELIKALKVHFDSCFREDGELLYSDHICTSDDVVDLIKLVENEPTAYDVDKIVEELEKESFTTTDTVCGGIFKAIRLSSAIEIVKQGGVSDNVCEWIKQYKTYNWKPSCETNSVYNIAEIVWFKYCPFCGKKIKVVE